MPSAPLLDAPSVRPSESPFVSPDDQGSDPVLAIVGVEILLLNCFRMTDLEKDTFEATTETWHDNFFHEDGLVDAVDNMDSTVTVTKQIPDGDMRVNSVTYSHTLRYNALDGALIPEQYAVLPFTVLTKNLELGNLLRSSIPACSGLLDVAIEVASVNSNMFVRATNEGDDAGIQMGAVVGIVAGGLVFTALAILAAVFMAKRRDTKTETNDGQPTSPPGLTAGDSSVLRSSLSRETDESSWPGMPLVAASSQPGVQPGMPLNATVLASSKALPEFKDQMRSIPEADAVRIHDQ